jgi:hypothetical protein
MAKETVEYRSPLFNAVRIPLFSTENAKLIVNRINHFGEVKSLYLHQNVTNPHQLFSIYNSRQQLTVPVFKPYRILVNFDQGYACMNDGEIEKFYDNLKADFFPDLSVLEITLNQVLGKHR